MADRLDQELNELLGNLNVEIEPSNDPTEGISLTCFYHKADRRDWQRLEQHLEAVQWQFRKLHQREIAWTTYEFNPKGPAHILQMTKATHALAHAHIVLLGLSVDMQLLLQHQQELYNMLLAKLEQVKQTRNTWGQPPYVAGIRLKEILWDESHFYSMEFLPRYQDTLAGQHHKDATCVEIARQVQEWIEEITEFTQRSMEE